ncbi:hypothetical protein TNIN_8821 [Trichonephila inaurata madagascariensis]|uniref:Uncharacterized protein n=1 Tax=Trichonephila inaurata madagascariensis TaxID=2747483 RepID=A0A8X6XKP9_9ARAC|nr:hypothetical protein TNIN_8821 [Trichonephila inaurata madagascariensis]
MSSKAQRRGSDYIRKRKRFHANQYTRKVSDTLDVDCISASAKKLCKENYLDKEVKNFNQSNGYRLINIDILLSELSKYLICPNCNTKAVLKEKTLYGLVSEFNVECYSCSTLTTFKSSSVIASRCEKWRGPKSGHPYEEWKLKHQPHCVKNHIGSSSKMEVDWVKEIFQRSVPQRNEKYTKSVQKLLEKIFGILWYVELY